jgi:hypothetical protein
MKQLGSEDRCQLWGNFSLIDAKFVTENGRYYRLCPIEGCQKIMPDIPRHLRDVHSFSRWQSRDDRMAGTKICEMIWTVPNESFDSDESEDPIL